MIYFPIIVKNTPDLPLYTFKSLNANYERKKQKKKPKNILNPLLNVHKIEHAQKKCI